jgi:hypothetical protein
VALPACGREKENGKASPALAAVLAYLPPDPALAGVLQTDLDRAPVKRLEQRASRLAGWRDLQKELEQQLASDLDFDRDIRPQLGNPLVVTAATVDQNDDDDYTAIAVEDPQSLRKLIERRIARGRATRLSRYKGALVIRDAHRSSGGADFTALHRDVLIQANGERPLHDAIDRSGGSDNLAGNEEIASELDHTTPDLLFHAVGDTGRLLGRSRDGNAAAARKVKWVRALGKFSTSAFATGDGVRFEFEQKTDAEDLSAADLPLATGSEPAVLHDRKAPIVVGVREPDRLYGFAEHASRAIDPGSYDEYQSGIRQLRDLGTDIHEDVLQKVFNLSLALRSQQAGTFQANLRYGKGEDLRALLESGQTFLEGLFSGQEAGAEIVTRGSGDETAWTVRRKSGAPLARYTVRGDTLVGSFGPVLPSPPAAGEALPGAEGALAVALHGKPFADLVRSIDRQGTPQLRGATGRRALALLSALGGLRFSVRAEPSALTGRGEVTLPDH